MQIYIHEYNILGKDVKFEICLHSLRFKENTSLKHIPHSSVSGLKTNCVSANMPKNLRSVRKKIFLYSG